MSPIGGLSVSPLMASFILITDFLSSLDKNFNASLEYFIFISYYPHINKTDRLYIFNIYFLLCIVNDFLKLSMKMRTKSCTILLAYPLLNIEEVVIDGFCLNFDIVFDIPKKPEWFEIKRFRCFSKNFWHHLN